ncbi:YxeA family protein [uncultured Clostridium sp.]|uniref:YxeA family protein n=1 Tax=uncultured Clostridium sp. TaxID=59620 RepID=UPI00262090BC|nr:YxeA family protein [uncultured Clostridium sp.]
MESIKEKMPMIIAVIVAIAICGIAFYFLENYESVYFTQIDNTKIQSISATDEMKYEYTLDCYNENGNKKEIKFKTSRELREDAYLMLEVRTFGVHSWKEVQANELPDKVKTALNIE